MTTEMLQQLVRQAREDPELFHALVFDSDTVLARLSYLDQDARDALSRSTPEQFVASLVGETREPGFSGASGCPPGVTCACTGETCGGLTCGYTYALAGGDYARLPEILEAGACGTHGNTCGYTCGLYTCANYTVAQAWGDYAGLPEILGAGACGGNVTCSCTTGTCDGTCGGSTCSVTCSGDSCGNTCGDSCGYTTNLSAVDRLDDVEGIRLGIGADRF
jgi:hypothetical protein